MDTANTFTPGQLVKFHSPEPREVNDRFIVIEMRGPRVLVGEVLSEEQTKLFPLGLTTVFLAADLVAA